MICETEPALSFLLAVSIAKCNSVWRTALSTRLKQNEGVFISQRSQAAGSKEAVEEAQRSSSAGCDQCPLFTEGSGVSPLQSVPTMSLWGLSCYFGGCNRSDRATCMWDNTCCWESNTRISSSPFPEYWTLVRGLYTPRYKYSFLLQDHWNRLPRKAVESPLWRWLKDVLDHVLRDMV